MRLPGWLTLPANETLKTFVLVAVTVELAVLLWAFLWQAELIMYQRDLIRELQVMLQGR